MSYKKKDFKTPAGILRFYAQWSNLQKALGIFFDISENKGCEINLYFDLRPSINISAHYTRKCDHAGFRSEICLFGLELEIDIYDARHWNYKQNRYYLPGEEQAEYATKGLND